MRRVSLSVETQHVETFLDVAVKAHLIYICRTEERFSVVCLVLRIAAIDGGVLRVAHNLHHRHLAVVCLHYDLSAQRVEHRQPLCSAVRTRHELQIVALCGIVLRRQFEVDGLRAASVHVNLLAAQRFHYRSVGFTEVPLQIASPCAERRERREVYALLFARLQ